MRFKDKVVVVTGAGSGIGQATAERFAKEGATVVVADVALERAETVAKGLKDAPGRALARRVDIGARADVQAMFSGVLGEFGRIDVLINNAGITRDAFAKKMKEEDWDAVIDVNLKGTFLCCQAVIPSMIEREAGRIVNTASVAIRGNMGQANYSAAKAGIVGLTRTLALELARHKVTVNCVAPGATGTPMVAAMPPEVLDGLKGRIPFKRLATPDEIASVHLFFASDDASYVTGQVLTCDGGLTLGA